MAAIDKFAAAWTELSDTPGSITALQVVRGDAGGAALEFVDLDPIYVNVSGDTMTGGLVMDAANLITFGTTNQFTVGHDGTNLVFTGPTGAGSARGFVFDSNIALGDAALDALTVLNVDFTPQSLPTGIPTASIYLLATIDNGIVPLPSAVLGETHVTGGTLVLPITFRADLSQDSNSDLISCYNYLSVFRSLTGTTGGFGDKAINFYAITPSLDGGGANDMVGFRCENLGSASVVNAIGVDVFAQVGATALNVAVRILGDGIGSNILLGAGEDATIYYDGTDLVFDPDLVGGGRVLIGVTGDNDMLLNDIEIDGAIDHDGATVGLYGTAPVTQDADIGAMTLTTHSGAPNTTLVDVAGTGDDATINDNLHELGLQINAIRTHLRRIGSMA